LADPATAGFDRLIDALRDPRCYPHAVQRIEVLQTHISAVFLTGPFAYKIKKPVSLGFLDFRSLAARRHYCEEELRLNRRTAPHWYLDVLPITGNPDAPRFGGSGEAIEYALRMRQFPQHALLDAMAREGRLSHSHMESLARGVADFHASAARAGPGTRWGSPEEVLAIALQNFDQIGALAPGDPGPLESLRRWTLKEHAEHEPLITERAASGFVRECHGDLHLRNIALLDGVPTPFDGIEFNDALRWIDVMSEVAFLAMDCFAHRLPALAWTFLDTYLQHTGDYAGLRVLRFYAVYRALVRAKVACIRAGQEGGGGEAARSRQRYSDHLRLADELAKQHRPALIAMHGVSGSGKSIAAAELARELGALRCRSDVERKRLHGLAPGARSGSGLDAGLYAPAVTAETYERLAEIARNALQAGYPVIVDAAFLSRSRRGRFRELARECSAPFAVVSCHVPDALLRERVDARERQARDASEAGLEVLERQLATQEPLVPEEAADVFTLDTRGPLASERAAAIALRLGLSGVRSERTVAGPA